MDEYEDEPRSIHTIPVSSQKNFKMKTEPESQPEKDKELYHSNSANNLLDLKEVKNKEKASKKKKHPILQRNVSAKCFDHYDKRNCEHCQGISRLMKQDKSKLSSYIENNSSFLKLFGNPRYNQSSPFLFVEDHKKRIDDDRIGLLPIPSKPRLIMKSKDENNKLYEMQRKIVMMRRYQYGKKFNEEGYLDDEVGEDFFDKINKIQSWWKQMYKIIYIQKVFRGFRIRRRVNFILNFIDILNNWQKILDKIKMRRILRKLVYGKNDAKTLPNNSDRKGYDFMSKVRRTGKSFLNNKIDSDNKNNNSYSKKDNNNNYPKKIKAYRDDSKNPGNDEEKNNYSDRNGYKNKKNDNDLNRNKNKNKSIPKDKINKNASLIKEYY
jgi:hypothetical protein